MAESHETRPTGEDADIRPRAHRGPFVIADVPLLERERESATCVRERSHIPYLVGNL
jgi:hypothetical protein